MLTNGFSTCSQKMLNFSNSCNFITFKQRPGAFNILWRSLNSVGSRMSNVRTESGSSVGPGQLGSRSHTPQRASSLEECPASKKEAKRRCPPPHTSLTASPPSLHVLHFYKGHCLKKTDHFQNLISSFPALCLLGVRFSRLS